MILSSHFPRTIRKALQRGLAAQDRNPAAEIPARAADSPTRCDADWAIREIVEDAMFDTAR